MSLVTNGSRVIQEIVARESPRTTSAPPVPLLGPALALMAGVAISEWVGNQNWLIWTALAAVALILVAASVRRLRSAQRKRDDRVAKLLISAFVAAAGVGLGVVRHQSTTAIPANHISRALDDEPVLTRIRGQIVSAPVTTPSVKMNPFLPFDPPSRTRFLLATSEFRTTDSSVPTCGLVRVTVDADKISASLGDTVIATGRLFRARGPRNPGELDWAITWRRQRVMAGLSIESAALVQREPDEPSPFHRVTRDLRASARSLLFDPDAPVDRDEAARLIDAMLLGQRSSVSRQLDEAFVKTGAVHILSVSGSHLGVVAAASWFVVRIVLRRRRRTTAVVTFFVIVTYAIVAEPNAPVFRSACMGVLGCAAAVFGRPLSGLNWLALAAIVILTFDPLQLFQPGFQLSFLQVAVLFTLVPTAYHRIMKRPGAADSSDRSPDAHTLPDLLRRRAWSLFLGIALASICAWAVSLPLVMFHFGVCTPFGAVQSMILTPLFTIAIVVGFLTLIVSALLAPLGALLGAALHGLMSILIAAVELLARLPGSLVEVPPPPAWLVVATYLLVLPVALAWLLRTAGERGAAGLVPAAKQQGARRPLSSRMPLVSAACIALMWLIWRAWPLADRRDEFALHVLSVGSGSANLLVSPHGRAALFDIGTTHNSDAGETARRAMRALRTDQLDLVTISHDNFDHYGGLPTLLQHCRAGRIIVNDYFVPKAPHDPIVRRFLELLPPDAPRIESTRAGQSLNFDATRIDVLWPPGDLAGRWDANETSLVLRVTISGRTIVIPGDIERIAMHALLDEQAAGRVSLSADVLIAPHHGSIAGRETAQFYRAVAPRFVIISTAKPRLALLALVRDSLGANCRVISTAEVGAIVIRIRPDGELTVETPYASSVH